MSEQKQHLISPQIAQAVPPQYTKQAQQVAPNDISSVAYNPNIYQTKAPEEVKYPQNEYYQYNNPYNSPHQQYTQQKSYQNLAMPIQQPQPQIQQPQQYPSQQYQQQQYPPQQYPPPQYPPQQYPSQQLQQGPPIYHSAIDIQQQHQNLNSTQALNAPQTVAVPAPVNADETAAAANAAAQNRKRNVAAVFVGALFLFGVLVVFATADGSW